jgi:lysophospholipase L1-like esterase
MSRSRQLIVMLVLVITGLLLTPGVTSAASYPRSMASTGDSITRAYNDCLLPYVDCPSASWSTGTSTAVNSQYLRLRALNSAITGHAHNDASGGAKMAQLNGQMSTAVSQRVQYVTVLMGGNDVCTSTLSGMTSVSTFQAQFTAAMQTITTGLPRAKVFVASIPNIYHLWEIFKDNFAARTVWSLFGVCQSLLADPLSTDPDDVARRQAVYQRVAAFNTVLGQVCAQYQKCRFDGNAVFDATFTTADITARDFFHPSVSGQAKLAAVTWAASFWAS